MNTIYLKNSFIPNNSFIQYENILLEGHDWSETLCTPCQLQRRRLTPSLKTPTERRKDGPMSFSFACVDTLCIYICCVCMCVRPYMSPVMFDVGTRAVAYLYELSWRRLEWSEPYLAILTMPRWRFLCLYPRQSAMVIRDELSQADPRAVVEWFGVGQ